MQDNNLKIDEGRWLCVCARARACVYTRAEVSDVLASAWRPYRDRATSLCGGESVRRGLWEGNLACPCCSLAQLLVVAAPILEGKERWLGSLR